MPLDSGLLPPVEGGASPPDPAKGPVGLEVITGELLDAAGAAGTKAWTSRPELSR